MNIAHRKAIGRRFAMSAVVTLDGHYRYARPEFAAWRPTVETLGAASLAISDDSQACIRTRDLLWMWVVLGLGLRSRDWEVLT